MTGPAPACLRSPARAQSRFRAPLGPGQLHPPPAAAGPRHVSGGGATSAAPSSPSAGEGEGAWAADEVAVLEGVFEARARLECCVSGVGALECLSLRAFGEYEEYAGPHVTLGKGYSSVVEVLAGQLRPGTLKLNAEVATIHWTDAPRGGDHSGPPVLVQCRDGRRFGADHVIVTVSLGVLKERAAGGGGGGGAAAPPAEALFAPPLPEWKVAAIRRMGFGTVDKIFLEFPEPGVWGEECLGLEMVWTDAPSPHAPPLADELASSGAAPSGAPAPPPLPAWARGGLHAFHPVNIRSRVVVAWLAGRAAREMEREPEEGVVEACLAAIRRFLPGGVGRQLPPVRAARRSAWSSDPLFRGSYSYVAAGSGGEDIELLAEPLPRGAGASRSEGDGAGGEEPRPPPPPLQLLFAGEATDRYHYSNTHGAFHSGMREAERILRLYASAPP